ncbi:InlB B-repeat-containing protein [Treponema sp. C6A8]|uniref:InlB B-repeat-containing protein n=1 Tax=Treponema sp. C6A8 TaxID=1410609 RepID=UPI0004808E12|nr:InlB B-repeat-containing protein [Treponema sp. C6A8]
MKKLALIFATISILYTTVLTSCMDLFDDHETALIGTITFDGNGGKMSDNVTTSYSQTFQKGQSVTLLSNAFTKNPAGKQFCGWSTSKTASTYEYVNGQKILSYYDLTLYAVWIEIETNIYVSKTSHSGTYVYESLSSAIEHINTIARNNSNYDNLTWTIHIHGEIEENYTLNGLLAGKLIIQGCEDSNDNSLKGVTDGGSVLTVSVDKPIEILNLKITHGTGNSKLDTEGNSYKAGGGIYISSGANVTLGTGTVICDNEATHGGGVYNEGTLIMNEGTIRDNEANTLGTTKGRGGGVYNANTMTVNGGLIGRDSAATSSTDRSNFAQSQGGGIYNTGSLVLYEPCWVKGNYANAGGGVRTTKSLSSSSQSRITNNNAGEDPDYSPDT